MHSWWTNALTNTENILVGVKVLAVEENGSGMHLMLWLEERAFLGWKTW